MRNNTSNYLFNSPFIYYRRQNQFDTKIKGYNHLTISNEEGTNFVSLKAYLPKEGTFEVPASFAPYFIYDLQGKYGTILEVLSTNSERVYASQLNQIFNTTYRRNYLVTPIVYKDTLYYCSELAIFNSDYTPLFLINVELTRLDENTTHKNKVVYHINKSAIASNPNAPIEKVIMSRFVKEIIAKNDVSLYFDGSILPIKLVIDDSINDFIRKPVTPTLENSTDEAINNFLVENVDILCQ